MSYWVSTKAKPTSCPMCRSATITATVDGRLCHVDAIAVTALGEYLARLAGRISYELRRGELLERDEYRVRGNRNTGPIMTEHQCRTLIAPQYRASWNTPTPIQHDSDTPPY